MSLYQFFKTGFRIQIMYLCMFLYRNPDKISTFVMKSPGLWKILRMDFKAWNLLHEDVCQILQKHTTVM